MRIAVWHNLRSGGGKRALYYHVRGLVERGHTIEAWCPPTVDQTYLPLADLIPEHVVPFDWRPVAARGPVGRLMAQYRTTTRQLEAMDHHCRACAEEIDRGGYDVLLANSCAVFRTTSIGRHVKTPGLLYLQEPFRWLYEALPQLPWLALPSRARGTGSWRHMKRFLRDLVDVHALRIQAREEVENARAFNTILVNSWFSRESVLRAYGIGAEVCYLGVDTDLFSDQRKPREGFVVGLGAIIPEKRVGLAIEALGRLREPRPELVWIGNAAVPLYRAEMERLARSRSVPFRVEVRIADKDVVDLLNRAAVLVYAPRLEPFGFAPLEAGACGLPVVAVAEGGVRETVRDGVNGLLVDDDPDIMARAIERVLSDPAYASRLGTAGAEMVRREWSVPASIDRLEARLTEVVRSGGSRCA